MHTRSKSVGAVGANAEGCKVWLGEGAYQAPRLASSGPSDVELLATVVDELAMAERNHRLVLLPAKFSGAVIMRKVNLFIEKLSFVELTTVQHLLQILASFPM